MKRRKDKAYTIQKQRRYRYVDRFRQVRPMGERGSGMDELVGEYEYLECACVEKDDRVHTQMRETCVLAWKEKLSNA